ncbi:MAG: type I glyceraldehyde-3-phosphate dehydrogenase [Pseudomonadota bacterium]
MAIRVAINGYGRIGRNVLCAFYEQKRKDIQIVAINGTASPECNAHLTKHDTIHGKLAGTVSHEQDVAGHHYLIVNGDKIHMFNEKDPSKLPWDALNIDVVLECTGVFRTKEKCQPHLDAGAKRVIISAPADKNACDATVVMGVNDKVLNSGMTVISNASCTTNGLAPMVKALHEKLGVESGLMTTIHSYTNDQLLVDGHHSDLYRARAAALNMIPTKTGAAQAVGIVIPELKGKLSGFAIRVPTANVSAVDLTFIASRETTREEVNAIMREASEGALKGILAYNTEPLVSSDFNHTETSSNFDSTQTVVIGNLVKVLAWYDNEWGFSCRMLDTAVALMKAK